MNGPPHEQPECRFGIMSKLMGALQLLKVLIVHLRLRKERQLGVLTAVGVAQGVLGNLLVDLMALAESLGKSRKRRSCLLARG
jgi:hypothetical protein